MTEALHPQESLPQPERLKLLKKVRLFSNLYPDDLEDVNKLMSEQRFSKDTVLFNQGDDANSLYVLVSGSVAIFATLDGVNYPYDNIQAPDYLGEMALLSDQPRSVTAKVASEEGIHTLVLSKDSFERFLVENINVMRQFINTMSAKLAEAKDMPELPKSPAEMLKEAIDEAGLEAELETDEMGNPITYHLRPKIN